MSLSYRTRLCSVGAILGAIATWVFAGGAAGAPAPVCQSSGLQPLNLGSGYSALNAVSVVSARDAVAVGSYGNSSYPSQGRTLIERWNGSAWSVQPSPSPGASSGLDGVAATSARNAWAVGNNSAGALIEHWNGKTWRVQASPRLKGGLVDVAATSARNAWAIGWKGRLPSAPGSAAVIEHWDGRTWKLQRSPRAMQLTSVAASSPTNAWAVGREGGGSLIGVIEHWNGRSWTVQLHVRLSGAPLAFSGVASGSPTSVWAVGTTNSLDQHFFYSLLEHWNGRAWKRQHDYVVKGLSAISATSPTDAWAIGSNTATAPASNVVEHWDGRRWTVRSHYAALAGSQFTDVSAKRGVGAWVVGDHYAGGRVQTLVLRCPA